MMKLGTELGHDPKIKVVVLIKYYNCLRVHYHANNL